MSELILDLYRVGAIRFGEFEIKRGLFAPFQIDCSAVISQPALAKEIALALWEKAMHLSFDLLCGCPFVGSCLATYLSWEQECPLVLRREGAKEMTHQIEGSYRSGMKCLVIQDVLVTGHDVLETVNALDDEGIAVAETLSFCDLCIGGKQKIKARGITSHAIWKMEEVIQVLFDAGKLKGDLHKLASDFLEDAHGR